MSNPVTPILTQRGVFLPPVGRKMVVALPGEHCTCEVEEVVSDDVIVVKLTGIVINKTGHGYKTGDPVACQRVVNDLQVEEWQPISERETTMREEASRLARATASLELEAREKIG